MPKVVGTGSIPWFTAPLLKSALESTNGIPLAQRSWRSRERVAEMSRTVNQWKHRTAGQSKPSSVRQLSLILNHKSCCSSHPSHLLEGRLPQQSAPPGTDYGLITTSPAMLTIEECNQFIQDGAVTKPDADISGIGVILAFLISAYVSFAVVLGAYTFGMVEPELLAPADVRIMRVRSRIHDHPRLHHLMQHAILVLSDQQIVTGVAIMAAGFVGLRSGETNVYHYQIVLYLAWLASSVPLSALTFLRPFLESHPAVRAWRLAGMVVLFFMLMVGLVPTVSYDWGIINISDPSDATIEINDKTGWGIPARCFWVRTYGDGVNDDAPIGYVLLVISYVWKVGDMFRPTRKLFSSGIRWPTERGIEHVLSITANGTCAPAGGGISGSSACCWFLQLHSSL